MDKPLPGSDRLRLLGVSHAIKLEAHLCGDMGRWFNDGMRLVARQVECSALKGCAFHPEEIDESQGRQYAQGQRRALAILEATLGH